MTTASATSLTSRRRLPASPILAASPVIAVLRASDAAEYERVIAVLVASGIRSIELTLTTPGAIAALPALLTHFGEDAEIGVGTILTTEQASRAIDAGAQYLVTPTVNSAVVTLAVEAGVRVFPGGLTPTELYSSWSAGATAVKIFPAGTVGASFGSHLRGPFPDIEFVPSGGISLDDVPLWLRAGAMAVSLGGPLLGDAFTGGSLGLLADRATRVTELAAEARSIR